MPLIWVQSSYFILWQRTSKQKILPTSDLWVLSKTFVWLWVFNFTLGLLFGSMLFFTLYYTFSLLYTSHHVFSDEYHRPYHYLYPQWHFCLHFTSKIQPPKKLETSKKIMQGFESRTQIGALKATRASCRISSSLGPPWGEWTCSV